MMERRIFNRRMNNREQARAFNVPVIYLGKVQTLCPIGEEMCGSVAEIYENAKLKLASGLFPFSTLEVTEERFLLSLHEAQTNSNTYFEFKRIVYCGVDKSRKKIFAFNYHETKGKEKFLYFTHAFLCSKRLSAKKLALAVSEFFNCNVDALPVKGNKQHDKPFSHSTKINNESFHEVSVKKLNSLTRFKATGKSAGNSKAIADTDGRSSHCIEFEKQSLLDIGYLKRDSIFHEQSKKYEVDENNSIYSGTTIENDEDWCPPAVLDQQTWLLNQKPFHYKNQLTNKDETKQTQQDCKFVLFESFV